MADERRYFKVTGKADNYSLVFPITPFPKFSASVDTKSERLLGVGEIDLGHTKNLIRCAITGIIPHPNNNYPFLLVPPKSTATYINWFNKWLNNQNDLLIEYYTKDQRIAHLDCRIQEFEWSEEDGTKNIHYSITFKEYRNIAINNGETNGKSVAESYGSSVYYVGEGDTLISIATKLFGDSSKWSYLQKVNGLTNPLYLNVGQEIKLY